MEPSSNINQNANKRKQLSIAGLLLVFVASLLLNNDASLILDEAVSHKTEITKTSSVSVKGERYLVDTTFIMGNINRVELLAHLRTGNIQDKRKVADIPPFIMNFLNSLSADNNFGMVNIGEEWQSGAFPHLELVNGKLVHKKLPKKQLIYFGIGHNIALMAWMNGGALMTENIAIVKFDKERIIDFWFTNRTDEVRTRRQIMWYLNGHRIQRESNPGC
jgi:hypothetical protein